MQTRTKNFKHKCKHAQKQQWMPKKQPGRNSARIANKVVRQMKPARNSDGIVQLEQSNNHEKGLQNRVIRKES